MVVEFKDRVILFVFLSRSVSLLDYRTTRTVFGTRRGGTSVSRDLSRERGRRRVRIVKDCFVV